MRKLLTFLLLAAIACGHPLAKNRPAAEIDRLDEFITEKDEYDKRKHQVIDSLTDILRQPGLQAEKKISIYTRLGEEYTLFKSDSAMLFYSKAIDLARHEGDSLTELKIRLKRIRPEMISGFYAEAHNEFRQLSGHNLPDSLLPDYYECGYRIYSFALNAVEKGSGYYDRYYQLANEYRRKWTSSLPENSVKRRLYEAEQAFWDNKLPLAKLQIGELLSELPEWSNDYAISAAILAGIFQKEGNREESMKYYALSAISDIQCSVKENESIYELSMLLYDLGDIDRAYRYIFASIEDAAFCNAQVRVYNASRMLPVIEAAHREEVKSHEKIMEIYMAIVSLLLIGLIITVFFLIKQMKKLSTARHKLKEANTTKDEYMGQFLELCSVYMKRLDSFTKLVNRKLTSGQTEDLVKMTKSTRFSEEQHRGFYQEFDNAFLKIYTTFVTDINELLRPEERIVVETPGTLTTELRIYALLRLGIEDSSKIAEFLKYSVNTIYTYRNKMKNKAIDRATFEESVMKIGVIE